MEILFWSAVSLFFTLINVFTPVTHYAPESYNLRLQITGLTDSIHDIGIHLFPELDMGHFPKPYVFPEPVDINPASPHGSAIPPHSHVLSSLPDAVKGIKIPKSADLLVLTCGVVVAVAIYVAVTQWQMYRLCKKGQAKDHAKDQPEDQAKDQIKDRIDRFDASIEAILKSCQDAAQELQDSATSKAKDFENVLVTLHSTADQSLEDAKQVQVQFQEQMAALQPQEHLESQVRDFDAYLAGMKGTADKNMEDQSKQLRDHIHEQMSALKPQELLEARMEEFDTDLADMKDSAGEAVENVKQLQDKYQEQISALQSHELPDRLLREFEGYLEEMKGTAGKAMDDETERLRGQFQDHGAALEQQKKDLKAQKRSFDASLTQLRENATKGLDTELNRVHGDFDKRVQKLNVQDRIDNQMSTFMADLAKMKKDADGHLSDRVKQLANDFRDQVRAAFTKFFSKDAFEQLVKEALAEQLNSALSDLSSGDLPAFLQQELGDMVKEQAKSSLPAPGATTAAPVTPVRPQAQVAEVPNAPEKPPQTAQGSSRRRRKGSSKSSTADSQGSEKEVSGTGTAPPTATHSKDNVGEASGSSPMPSPGLQTSQWAPPTGPKALLARDKGKQPVRNETKEVSMSPSLPSPGLTSSQWAPPTGPRALQNQDKGKQPIRGETKEVSSSSKGPSKGLQSSRFAPPSPNPGPSAQDKGKQPEKGGEADAGKRLSGTQASIWATPSGPSQVKGDSKDARSTSTGQIKGGAKEFAPGKPSAQPVEAQGSRTESTVKSPSPAKGLIKMGAYQVTEAPPSLRPTPQTANVPAVTGTELKSPFSGQEGQKDSEEDSQGLSTSKWAIPDVPKLPRPDSRRPPPRAGLVEENLGIKKVFASLRQSRWPPAPTAPKTEVEKPAPVKKDETKAGPGPAAPEKDSKVLAPVEKGQAKEGSGPAGPPKDTAKSASWADLVEEEMDGSPGASQSTGAAAKTDAPPAPGLAKSMWADDPSPAKEASKEPSAGKEEKKKKSSGLGASRWA